jgi:PAS domain S-box-containing protein
LGLKVIHPEDRQIIEEVLQKKVDVPNHFTIRWIHKSGEIIWTEHSIVQIFDDNGNLTAIEGIARNISKRKETEFAFLESKEKYEKLFESAKDAIFLVENEVFIDCNPSTVEMFGCNSRDDVLNRSPWEFSPEYQADGSLSIDKAKNYLRKAIKGKGQQFYWQHCKKNKEVFDAEVSLNSLKINNKNYILAMVRDVTKRVNAEKQVKYAMGLQKLLMSISTRYINIELEDSSEAIQNALKEIGEFVEADRAYVFDYHFNEGLCTNTFEWCQEGISPEIQNLQSVPLEEMPYWVKTHTEGETMYIPSVEDLPEGGLKNILVPQGIKSLIAVPMIKNNKCYGFLGFDSVRNFRTYTEREKALLEVFANILINLKVKLEFEQELIRAKEKAEESDKLKSAFLTNISHEIRTPMNGILGFTNLLKEPKLSGEEQQEYVEFIEKSGARMLNTINAIIDVSHIETGDVKLSKESVDIYKLVQNVYSNYLPEAEQKGLDMFFSSRHHNKELIAETDGEKINTVLSNLVNNAIKFTNEGVIELVLDVLEDSFKIAVKDSGQGIPEEKRESIFKLFVQADSSYSKLHEGAGLGLTICKAYVDMLGGEIWLESIPGKGSTFHFTIPYMTSEKNEIKTKVKRNVEAEKLKISELKVLIVEDDEPAISFLKILMEKYSKETLIAETGTKALNIFSDNPDIDLILMDIKIPNMDGYQVTSNIREMSKEVVIIAQTAYATSGDYENAMKAGCNDFITKPIQSKQLYAIIEKYFNIH